MNNKDITTVNVFGDLSLFPSMPQDYSPTVKILGIEKPEENFELFVDIISDMVSKGYPNCIVYVYVPKHITDESDIFAPSRVKCNRAGN